MAICDKVMKGGRSEVMKSGSGRVVEREEVKETNRVGNIFIEALIEALCLRPGK